MARVQKNLLPLDDSVKLPAAVRAAADRAAQVHKQAYEIAPPSDQTVKIVEAPPKEAANVVVEEFKPGEPAKIQAPAPQSASETHFSLPGDPPVVAQPPAPAPQPQAEAPKPKERDFERELGAERGRFRQASQALQDANSRIAQLESMVISLTQPAPQPTPQELNPMSLVTDDERNTYGEDFISVVGKVAQGIAGRQLTQMQSELQQLKAGFGQVAQNQQQSARQQFFVGMDNALPGWRETNSDQNFIGWLGLPDPASGVIRSQLLSDAVKNGDVRRAVWFFKAYAGEQSAPAAPTPASSPTQLTSPSNGGGKVPLEMFAAPGRAKSAAAPAEPDNELIPRSRINRFYHLVSQGFYNDNPKEKARLEGLLFKAMQEGRVIEG